MACQGHNTTLNLALIQSRTIKLLNIWLSTQVLSSILNLDSYSPKEKSYLEHLGQGKMKKHILALFILFAAIEVFAQESEPVRQDTIANNFEFTLKDGTKLIGQLIDQNKESYTIKTINFGTIKIASNQVVSIILLDQKTSKARASSSSYYENQFGYKYFIFPTAIPAEPKKWFYTNQYVFFSNFTYGISKHVSGGFSFFTFVPTSMISPTLKVTLNPAGKTKFALRGQYIYIRENNTNNAGFFQAIITRGDAQNNFTLAVGKFISNRGADEGSILTFGFAKKVSPKLSVISENNVIVGNRSNTNTFGLLSVGFRFDRRMHAFDLGLYAPTSGLDRNINLIPYVGFNLRLSK
jgi:hypothetical protein